MIKKISALGLLAAAFIDAPRAAFAEQGVLVVELFKMVDR